jgi:hypothetical protein
MKRSSATLLTLVASLAVSRLAPAAEIKAVNPTCQNAYAVLGWSRFDVQEAQALAKLADARLRKGRVQEAMGDPCGAFQSYQASAVLASRGVDPAKVEESRARIAALEPSLRSKVTVRAELVTAPEKTVPAADKDLLITLDGVRVVGPTFTVAPGSHSLTIAVKGYKPHLETLAVCNQTPMVEVVLPREESMLAAPAPAASSGKPAADADDDDDDDDGEKSAAGGAPSSATAAASASAAPGSTASGASGVAAEPAAPTGLVLRGTSAQRRELSKWSIAANDHQKAADFWAMSKKLPWIKVGWVLGRRRHLQQVEAVSPGDAKQVNFRQYRVKGQEGAYAYVANCGTGTTCNAIAKSFYFTYRGVGVPQVECATLPEVLESPMTPEIPIPTPEEIAQRDAEYAAMSGGGDDDEDDKASDAKDDDKGDDDDDDD